MWGLVHPVLLTAQFAFGMASMFDDLIVTTRDDFGLATLTDLGQLRSGRLDASELLIIGRVNASQNNVSP
jgi:hypothetical protein